MLALFYVLRCTTLLSLWVSPGCTLMCIGTKREDGQLVFFGGVGERTRPILPSPMKAIVPDILAVAIVSRIRGFESNQLGPGQQSRLQWLLTDSAGYCNLQSIYMYGTGVHVYVHRRRGVRGVVIGCKL